MRVLLLFGVGAAWAIACGGPQPLGGAGSVCFRADECQAGLACVPETMGASKHVCSADLSGIVSMVDGAAPEGGDMPQETGGSPAQPQGGSAETGGYSTTTGTGGKPGVGGTSGRAGGPSSGGSSPSGGSAAGGKPAVGGAPSAGGSTAAGGSNPGGSANGGSDSGGSTAGSGG